jgi:carbon storage regulator
MLYLTRKIGQSIIINDKIEVKVIEVSGKNVKIGIEFPKSATVLRKEVYDNIVEQNIESSKSAMDDIGFFAAMTQKIKEEKKGDS